MADREAEQACAVEPSASPLWPPAPWGVEVTEGNLWVGPLRESGKVGDIVVGLPCDRFYTDEYQARQHALAALIAATPELVEALRRYMNCDRAAEVGGDTPFNQARAALAKAGASTVREGV